MNTAEHQRLAEVRDDIHGWRRWGPYLAERSWGTVREDYSCDGNAWQFLSHDLARSKAYRWGDDGIAGICDRFQLLCFAPAFWNGRDAILKERLFGLTPHDGNHGEDVKECYYHLDNTPTHSYMKYVYKYPQSAFPYEQLIRENRNRHGRGPEFELIDTGVFDDDAYFDIVIEYAKATAEDIVIRIEAINRSRRAAPLHILPHLWFRNTWRWADRPRPTPLIQVGRSGDGFVSVRTDDSGVDELRTVPVQYRLGQRVLYAAPDGTALFTDNETNAARVFGPGFNGPAFTKDAFHCHVIEGKPCVNPSLTGTKAALHYFFPAIAPGASVVIRLRLTDDAKLQKPLADADAITQQRRTEADEYFSSLHAPNLTEDERRIQRQAWAGLLWTKQSYIFDVNLWLDGESAAWPPPHSHRYMRNQHWRHLNSLRIMTVPDKWEYPWFAAWDLAFQCVALAIVDPGYAKDQLWLLLFEQFQHPNGQVPAYEWEFSDLNPPVHAWAVFRVFHMDRRQNADKPDWDFLERSFHKLLINFAWWVNKVDREGNCIFEGGFLGLDNITVVDRSIRCGDGSTLEQADATGWMGMFCLNMMRIALELAKINRVYENLAIKFFQHYAYIASAMMHMGGRDYQLWDDKDGFFYDVLRRRDGSFRKFRVRSLVGLIPLFAVERLEDAWLEPFPKFRDNMKWFLKNRADIVRGVVHPVDNNGQKSYALTVLDREQLTRILARLWDESEFLSPFGIRSLSKFHERHPFEFDGFHVGYEPAEAISKIKGGNSNWRGPIWFPICFLLIESFRKLGAAFGQQYAFNTLGGRSLTFPGMARELADRLIALFLRGHDGRRPIFGDANKFQDDPHWRDLLWFPEYFHADTGAGLGAMHQTGWTALVANLLDEYRR